MPDCFPRSPSIKAWLLVFVCTQPPIRCTSRCSSPKRHPQPTRAWSLPTPPWWWCSSRRLTGSLSLATLCLPASSSGAVAGSLALLPSFWPVSPNKYFYAHWQQRTFTRKLSFDTYCLATCVSFKFADKCLTQAYTCRPWYMSNLPSIAAKVCREWHSNKAPSELLIHQETNPFIVGI